MTFATADDRRVLVTVEATALEALMRSIREAHTAVRSIVATPGNDGQAEAVLDARMRMLAMLGQVSELQTGAAHWSRATVRIATPSARVSLIAGPAATLGSESGYLRA